MYLVAFTLFYANAQQARISHHYKNYMEKLLKTNTTMWFNRIYRFNHLMPKYMHMQELCKRKLCVGYKTVHLLVLHKSFGMYLVFLNKCSSDSSHGKCQILGFKIMVFWVIGRCNVTGE